MSIYRQFIIDLYKNPLNKRAMRGADISASGANVTCGDRIRIYAKVTFMSSPRHSCRPCLPAGRQAGKRGSIKTIIKDISFEGEGCAILTASASLLTEKAKGKSIASILKWNSKNIFDSLGFALGPSRLKCGLLPLETLQQGIKRIIRKTPQQHL